MRPGIPGVRSFGFPMALTPAPGVPGPLALCLSPPGSMPGVGHLCRSDLMGLSREALPGARKTYSHDGQPLAAEHRR